MKHSNPLSTGPLTRGERAPLLELREVSLRYGAKTALNNVHLSLNSGQIVGLVGANGSGKTSLLRVLAGLERNYSGSYTIASQPFREEMAAEMVYLPDHIPFPDHYNVREILRAYRDHFENFDFLLASDMVARYGLSPKLKLSQMSRGMKEKLMIAMSLSRRARIYLMDEPMGGVDVEALEEIVSGIIDSFREDSLLILSTHLLRDLEPLIDRVVIMDEGQILLSESMEELSQNYSGNLAEIYKEVLREKTLAD
ncbi:MAG: ABC transporter ATP-binding protein [Tissierellia bacterium]|nr:ABC transporter ATP-binding protein [Tissierellia bacterium]